MDIVFKSAIGRDNLKSNTEKKQRKKKKLMTLKGAIGKSPISQIFLIASKIFCNFSPTIIFSVTVNNYEFY